MARTDNTLTLAALSLASGCLDVTVFFRLGGVFASVMTSNLVFVAVAAARAEASLAVHCVAALAGYVAGVAAGSVLARPSGSEDRLGTRPLNILLSVECALLVGYAAWWIAFDSRPSGWRQVSAVVAAALAMGLQGAAARALGNPRAGTTYLTGTLTGVVSAIAVGRRPDTVALLCLCGLLAGAAVGAALLQTAPSAAPLPCAAALAFAAALSWRRRGTERL